jgi:hypothetical protein
MIAFRSLNDRDPEVRGRVNRSRAARRCRIAFWGLMPLVAVLGVVATGTANAAPPHRAADSLSAAVTADIDPTQSAWFDYSKDLKDPTLTYTQHVLCSGFTPSGQSTLYPYIVPDGSMESGRYTYRNNSTKGVTVTVNPAATSDLDDKGIAFFVTSLHVTGNYAFKVSIDCKSNDWGDTSVSPPTLDSSSLGPNGVTIGATFSSSISNSSTDFSYYVEYGAKAAVYTSKSPTKNDTLPESGSLTEKMELSSLQPDTEYHYRVVMFNPQPGVGQYTNYSGADQTFTTK